MTRRDHSDRAAAVEIAPTIGRRSPPGRDLLERVHGVDAGHDLVLADDPAEVPAAAGIEGHPLDEPHLDGALPAERRQVDDLVVVDVAHHDGVDLDGIESCFQRRSDAVEHSRQFVAPGHRREAFTVQRVEADVDPPQPGVAQPGCEQG